MAFFTHISGTSHFGLVYATAGVLIYKTGLSKFTLISYFPVVQLIHKDW